MDKRKQTLYQRMLARISLGAVPVDGIYWLDPREAQKAALQQERSHKPDERSHKPEERSHKPEEPSGRDTAQREHGARTPVLCGD